MFQDPNQAFVNIILYKRPLVHHNSGALHQWHCVLAFMCNHLNHANSFPPENVSRFNATLRSFTVCQMFLQFLFHHQLNPLIHPNTGVTVASVPDRISGGKQSEIIKECYLPEEPKEALEMFPFWIQWALEVVLKRAGLGSALLSRNKTKPQRCL